MQKVAQHLREVDLAELTTADCCEFLAYWAGKRTGVPVRRAFDPLIEKPHMAPCMYLYEVVDGGADFRLRLVGTAVVELFGGDPTGRCLSEIWDAGEVETGLALMRKCMASGEPVAARGSFHWRDREFIEWRCVIAPLRLKGRQVEQFLCYLSHSPRRIF